MFYSSAYDYTECNKKCYKHTSDEYFSPIHYNSSNLLIFRYVTLLIEIITNISRRAPMPAMSKRKGSSCLKFSTSQAIREISVAIEIANITFNYPISSLTLSIYAITPILITNHRYKFRSTHATTFSTMTGVPSSEKTWSTPGSSRSSVSSFAN